MSLNLGRLPDHRQHFVVDTARVVFRCLLGYLVPEVHTSRQHTPFVARTDQFPTHVQKSSIRHRQILEQRISQAGNIAETYFPLAFNPRTQAQQNRARPEVEHTTHQHCHEQRTLQLFRKGCNIQERWQAWHA